jgi:hypothetical protein
MPCHPFVQRKKTTGRSRAWLPHTVAETAVNAFKATSIDPRERQCPNPTGKIPYHA